MGTRKRKKGAFRVFKAFYAARGDAGQKCRESKQIIFPGRKPQIGT
jgi:hypothetical protein